MDGFIVTTLKEAKASGNLREETVRMANILGLEINAMIQELDIGWLYEEK
jgi:hypothetical protein